jgi:hypothetical protein
MRGYSCFSQPIKDLLSFPTKFENSHLHGILRKEIPTYAESTFEGFSITKFCSQPSLKTSFQFWERDNSSYQH